MSKIEVNTVDTQCGTNLTVGAACKSVTVAGNDIRSNNYKAADGGVIVSQSGTTITLGASGDTVTLASGASQSGFGRSGSVDWQTTKKTADFTAANGEGYFVDTSSGAVNASLPAGSAGAIVAFADYTRTFGTNSLQITPNGSEKIGGVAAPAFLDADGQAGTFVYIDSTEGWINVQETSSSETGNPNLVATGGTVTTSGNCKIHTFTGPGTFEVVSVSNTAAENTVSHVVVGGGGAGADGGGSGGGGGGAGGFREVKSPITPYSASPLDGYPSAPNRVTVTAQSYPITVGAGGADDSGPNQGDDGSPSVFSTITATGGGGGGSFAAGNTGGSGGGGGGSYTNSSPDAGGAGNTPSTSPSQGNPGGESTRYPSSASNSYRHGGGGGGAGAAGGDAPDTPSNPGPSAIPGPGAPNGGGNGVTTSITASPVAYGGGGGGVKASGGPGQPQGGSGGGGNGSFGQPAHGESPNGAATAGSANTGGGGGGYMQDSPTYNPGSVSTGGSGIVIIRYKYQ